jgi:hypothetical protein
MSITAAGHDVLDGADQGERIRLVMEGLLKGLCTVKPAGDSAVMIINCGGAVIHLRKDDVDKMLTDGLIIFDGKPS